ncbi:hypothetical protein TCAL_16089, partial [Tigriopus californicus]
EHERAFISVKQALSSPPILAHFDILKATRLLTDASRLNGLGYAMLQKHGTGDNPQWKLVKCGSRFLSDAETHERLCLRRRKDKNVKQKTVYESHSLQLRKLTIGQQVRIRHPQESTWSRTGTILQIRQSGRSYLVQSNGRTLLRNRIYLKPMRDGPISADPETAQEIPSSRDHPRRHETSIKLVTKVSGGRFFLACVDRFSGWPIQDPYGEAQISPEFIVSFKRMLSNLQYLYGSERIVDGPQLSSSEFTRFWVEDKHQPSAR